MVADEPLRERRWAMLALALYRDGRPGRPRYRALQRARAKLAEVGLEPGAELVALERSISSQDPQLVTPGPASGPLARSSGARPVRLPAELTRFVGRAAELATSTSCAGVHGS